MLTAEQCRAARGLLGWSQARLAEEAAVGIVTVHQLEGALARPRRSTLDVIRRAFERAGVIFIDQDDAAGPGVRLSRATAAANHE
jgi:transcriptional regulator with XRE-family HTH domain